MNLQNYILPCGSGNQIFAGDALAFHVHAFYNPCLKFKFSCKRTSGCKRIFSFLREATQFRSVIDNSKRNHIMEMEILYSHFNVMQLCVHEYLPFGRLDWRNGITVMLGALCVLARQRRRTVTVIGRRWSSICTDT